MDLAVLKQVLALPEHDRSCPTEIAISRALGGQCLREYCE
jgi:hypothetical protein